MARRGSAQTLVLAAALLLTPPAGADSLGISDAKIVLQLEALYQQAVAMVERLEAQEQRLSRLKGAYERANQTHDLVRDAQTGALLARWQRRVQDDFGLLFEIQDLAELPPEQRAEALRRRLDRTMRTARAAGDEDTAQRLGRAKAAVERDQLMAALEERMAAAADRANHEISPREAAQIQAQADAIQAQLALAEARRAQRAELARSDDAALREATEATGLEALRRIGGSEEDPR